MAGEDLATMISRVSLGDRAAFSALYSATSPKLFSVCLRILKDRTDAEDALQEIFVKIWHRADRYAASGINPLGWLTAIARNHSIDLLRARRPVASNIDEEGWDIADSGSNPEQAAVLKGEGKRIDRCMEELESDRAGAVRSAYVEGLSYQELADRHAVPLNTMRTWLRRSLLKLRECLDR
ncbi:RNA polymerase sigma-70 factor (ECF subfamily) [Neorhizobium huautlense]|uniref:RNA polymerase sigma-70 factor (ECF subfamily) n=1 Tax=Neorhizobium huautlense TaxID=67774 RepID=A0ABT9Q0L8_9HYPH|nr:sigma-70 family RNA polymerase sigma factor [Neorhizobium huautlense]MDP9840271.1 RNA polymerase sigma-70 factor (ECF subfamily) [Neorhizobium huautlense]